MKNKNIGFLIIGISLVIGFIVFIFNRGLEKIVSTTCDHGPSCSMYQTISVQTWISLAIAGLIFIIGLFFVFLKENVQIVTKKIKEQKKKVSLENLDSREKEALKLIQENGGIFQAELMEKMNIGKVGITRLLDKLEAKQIVERKRRGMNNFVVIKN